MTDLIAQDKFGGAGIPGQSAHTVPAELEAIITGDSPDTWAVDYPVEESQNLKALTVVGLNRFGRVVPAVHTPVATHARGVLTITSGQNASAGETVTIGVAGADQRVYTFRAAAAAANDVTIGADDDESAANLAEVINATHGSACAEAVDNTVVVFAKQAGRQGNAIATTETMGQGAFGSVTLTGGTGGVKAIGILGQDIVTAAGERPSMPVYRGGVYNPARLIWDDSFSGDAVRKDAFVGAPSPTSILVRAIRAYTLE